MDGICVGKTRHLENAHVSAITYTSLASPVLTERVWSGMTDPGNWESGRLLHRRSVDNGRTWETIAEGRHEEPRGDRVVRWCQPVYHLDPNGILVEFANQYEWWANREETDFGPNAEPDYLPMRTGRIFYRLSPDEGETWGAWQQVIQSGPQYDAVHWADGITYERNAASFSELHRVVQLPDGTLLLPIAVTLLDGDGELVRWPDRFGDTIWPVEACACLIGRWRENLSGLAWELSNIVSAPEYMTRCLCEPAVAEVAEGKLMMLMRGASTARQALPGLKFLSISKDGGRHWGPAVPLTYPDASYVHSPASVANLFRSRRNGRIYVVANILPQPCRNADPRYPLAIAEVDPTYLWVLPETVTTIADREPHQPRFIRFSNWQLLEDRETGDPAIFMTEGLADAIIPGATGECSPDAFRYDIKLPD